MGIEEFIRQQLYWDDERGIDTARTERDHRTLQRHAPVEPDRSILIVGSPTPDPHCLGCGYRANGYGHTPWPCVEVRELAAIWADDPEYREEWAVTEPFPQQPRPIVINAGRPSID